MKPLSIAFAVGALTVAAAMPTCAQELRPGAAATADIRAELAKPDDQGPRGPRGRRGKQGPPGPQGPPGESLLYPEGSYVVAKTCSDDSGGWTPVGNKVFCIAVCPAGEQGYVATVLLRGREDGDKALLFSTVRYAPDDGQAGFLPDGRWYAYHSEDAWDQNPTLEAYDDLATVRLICGPVS